jgi:hypothetical protein
MLAACGATEGEPTDPDFNQTVLLLHGDGTNGAQNNTFLDGSTNNFTITRNGNTTQGTFTPFSLPNGEWSNFFDGSGDYLTLNGGTPLTFGTGDFTIEFWYYSNNAGSQQILYDGRPASTNGNYVTFYKSSTNVLELYVNNAVRATGTTSIAANAWHHVALCRSGTSTKMFLNGTQEGSTYTDSTNYLNGSNRPIIGADGSTLGNLPLNGYLSGFRVLKGTAQYTSNFTPPTAPLTAITNTSLLTCQSNRFVDNSTNAFAITRNGDVRVTPFSPFAPSAAYDPAVNGGSGYFDGTGDYLTAPANAAFQPGTGDFSVEAWFNCETTAVAGLVGTNYTGASPNTYVIVTLNRDTGGSNTAGAVIGGVIDGVQIGSAGSVFSNFTWNHVVFCRTGSTLSIFLNGSRIGTTSNSTNITPNIQFEIANTSALNRPFKGYVANARMIKGSHPYDATQTTCTVPTAPLTAITNTSLLCNFTNAGIFDNTGKNVLETVGNAQIDTTTKKYGTGSMEFDGTGDYLISNSSTIDLYAFGSGDFTIEMWLYVSVLPSAGTYNVFYDSRTPDGAYPTITLKGSTVVYYANSADRITSSSISATTWYHIAVCRSGTSTKLFINGTQEGSTYTDSTVYLNTAGRPVIGAANNGTSPFNGYIDDLRITKGVARYTANFTPPTAAFPNE